MSPLTDRIARFARSPKGRRLAQSAQRYAQSPAARRRIEDARRRFGRKP